MASDARLRRSSLYGPGSWIVNGTRTVTQFFVERLRGVTAPKDLSDSGWTAFLRAYKPSAPHVLLMNEEMSKGAGTVTPGDDGEMTVDVALRSAYPELRFLPVLANKNVPDTATPSGFEEFPAAPWAADSVVAGCGASA